MPVRPVDANAPTLDNLALSEEEKAAVQARISVLDKLLSDDKKARFKIEILFTDKRALTGPVLGMLTLWESGNQLHGGGDTKTYICPTRLLGRGTCEAIITDGTGIGHLVCPGCGTAWKGEEVIGEILGRFSMARWADLVLYYYVKLGHNADIVIKFPHMDLRNSHQADRGAGEVLTEARRSRQHYIYTLKNIIKDTSAGADLHKRFLAFLTA